MTRMIEYVEVALNAQLGPIAVMHGIADQVTLDDDSKAFVTSTHDWLSDMSVWSLLASEYFGLPYPNIAVAIRIAEVVKKTEKKGPILLIDTDHGMLVQAIQTPRPCLAIQQPPALLYQHCSKIFQAILEAKTV